MKNHLAVSLTALWVLDEKNLRYRERFCFFVSS